MRFDLDWEEGVFRGLLSLWRRVAPADEADLPGTVHLDERRRALTTLAQIVAGEPVRIVAARGVGGVRGRDLLLPRRLALGPDEATNRRLFSVRAAVSASLRRITRNPDSLEPFEALLASDGALASLALARAATDWLAAAFPRFASAHDEAVHWTLASRPDPSALRGRARLLEELRSDALRGHRPWEDADRVRALAGETSRGPESPGIAIWGEWMMPLEAPDELSEDGALPEGSDSEADALAPALEELRRVTLDPKEKEDAVLVHTFEKVETLDSYRGGARDTDGADELDAHLEALQEVDLGDLLRGDDPAHSVLRADVQLDVDVPDVSRIAPDERGLPYDEWDARRRRYRPGWCTVYPAPLRASKPSWAGEALARQQRLIRDLHRRLAIHRTGLRPVGRQLDGEDVDLGALVDAHGALRAGRGRDPRLYLRQQRRRRDFATTVLLDVSLSTDAWVENRRVLDVARDAVLVLGEVSDQLGDRLQVLAFASHTRNRCRVWEVKGWRDPWPTARARLGALEPQGYTRIGPALRHAADRLAAEPAERRLLLLVSDGKPTDYDRYEGRYGIADVRQALREAERRQICAHALAVDAVARDYLPPMFGPGAWNVLPHPDQLPDVLTRVYGRLTGR